MNNSYYDNGPYVAALLSSREIDKTAKANDMLWLGFLSALALAGVIGWQLKRQSERLASVKIPTPSTTRNDEDNVRPVG